MAVWNLVILLTAASLAGALNLAHAESFIRACALSNCGRLPLAGFLHRLDGDGVGISGATAGPGTGVAAGVRLARMDGWDASRLSAAWIVPPLSRMLSVPDRQPGASSPPSATV